MGERGRMPSLGCARQSRQPIDGPAHDGRKSAAGTKRGRRQLSLIYGLLNLQRARLFDPIHAALDGPLVLRRFPQSTPLQRFQEPCEWQTRWQMLTRCCFKRASDPLERVISRPDLGDRAIFLLVPTMLTVLTQMPAFISVNRSERLPTSAGGRLRQPGLTVQSCPSRS
jgi:hypothetical protein